ncbi:MAG: sulfotransferase domain-containing protein [Candidatus Omnitrophica bacterium]|nr:sulfotransferase domain-containing protein [Candidatus Omnitrophota bacterium]
MDNRFLLKNIYRKAISSFRSPKTFIFYLNEYVFSQEDKNCQTYIISYPKCGRTWLRLMLDKAILLSQGIKDFDRKKLNSLKDRPRIKFDHGCSNWVPAPFSFKEVEFLKRKYQGKKAVLLFRDIRDVLVSSYMHLKYRERLVDYDISHFIRNQYLGALKVITCMNLWFRNRDVFSDCLIMTYEGLHDDVEKHLRILLDFIGLAALRQEEIIETIKFGNFKNMQDMETRNAHSIPWLRASDAADERTFKTRKGQVGGYKSELSSDDILFINKIVEENIDPELKEIIYYEQR